MNLTTHVRPGLLLPKMNLTVDVCALSASASSKNLVVRRNLEVKCCGNQNTNEPV